ncbi:hypothetical protein [Rhodococcus phage P19]|nr:hypothetical protein [Rhodococcus phage P19]
MEITREEFDKLAEDVAAIREFVDILKAVGVQAASQGGMAGVMAQKLGLQHLAGV